jgi:hypothetical protein
MVDVIKKDTVIEYRCDIDGTLLWVEYPNGEERPVNSCTHWKWETVSNGCYPEQLDPIICHGTDIIVKYGQKRIKDGTTYYFLIPVFRDYQ